MVLLPLKPPECRRVIPSSPEVVDAILHCRVDELVRLPQLHRLSRLELRLLVPARGAVPRSAQRHRPCEAVDDGPGSPTNQRIRGQDALEGEPVIGPQVWGVGRGVGDVGVDFLHQPVRGVAGADEIVDRGPHLEEAVVVGEGGGRGEEREMGGKHGDHPVEGYQRDFWGYHVVVRNCQAAWGRKIRVGRGEEAYAQNHHASFSKGRRFRRQC